MRPAPGSDDCRRKDLRVEIAKRYELVSLMGDILRVAVTDARLAYIEGEYASYVSSSVAAALTAARQGKSESEIAVVIEEHIAAVIDTRLKQLAAISPRSK